MAKTIPSSFNRYEFTPQEAVTASVFTYMQKQHIHNLRTEIAESLLMMDDDIENPLKHVKERARLQGMLDAYAGLINLSESAETVLNQAR